MVRLDWVWVRWWGNGGVFEFPGECCQSSEMCGGGKSSSKEFLFFVFLLSKSGDGKNVFTAPHLRCRKNGEGGVFVSGGGMRSEGALV